MPVSPLAGSRPDASMLIDLDALLAAYHEPPRAPVAFGTSGHRGSSLKGTFTEAHVLAISEAIAATARSSTGPLFVARDTHALSEPAFHTAVAVFSAHGLDVRVDADGGYTPTPALSHAILTHPDGTATASCSRRRTTRPTTAATSTTRRSGGPAPTRRHRSGSRTRPTSCSGGREIRDRRRRRRHAARLRQRLRRRPRQRDRHRGDPGRPACGSAPTRWAARASPTSQAIAERHGLDLTVVNDEVDPTFRFVPLDHDGKTRMDCSSPYVMAGLLEHRDRFDVSVACDPDADRHGIVTPGAGLLNPNHYLAVAIHYLFGGARDWPDAGIGKTLVSSTDDRPRGRATSAAGSSRSRSASSGSSTACSTARSASAARRAPAPRSCAATARRGRPTRTASCSRCWPRRSRPRRVRTRVCTTRSSRERFGAPVYRRVDSPITPEKKERCSP